MRIMKKGNQKLVIKEHIILRNFWEYYVTDAIPCEDDADVIEALVLGFETELGDVWLPEIKPYIISRTKDLRDVMSAPGWTWEAK